MKEPMKKYQIIYADPPWRLQSMSDTSWKKDGAPLEGKYPTMSVDEIQSLPVVELADENCGLFLWSTQSTLQDALYTMKLWGFKYHITITWAKGSGFCLHGFNRNTELLLYGYKGKMNLNTKGKYIPTLIVEKKTKHSVKPITVYELLENNSPTPRIELFARKKREGWDVWGNEVESDIELGDSE